MTDFTHKGWFGICPVYLADLDTDTPMVAPRWAMFEPLFWLSVHMMDAANWLHAQLNPEHESGYFFRITGEL